MIPGSSCTSLMLRPAALALLASVALIPVPVTAQQAHEYYLARLQSTIVPRQLSDADAAWYRGLFFLIEQENWPEVQRLFTERTDGPLHAVALARYYLHPRSPRVEAEQIRNWLATGQELPMAAALVRLGSSRGLTDAPRLPTEAQLRPVSGIPRRVRPSSIDDTSMPDEVRSSILNAITNDDPDLAASLLAEVEPNLTPEALAEWRTRVAWSYFIENRDTQSLLLARTVAEGAGPWVAEGEWTRGLAAFRLSDCDEAQAAFRNAARQAQNVELRSAALYWASRAALRCRQPAEASRLLNEAAGEDQTLYGMLAAEQLGRRQHDRYARADLTAEDWVTLSRHSNIRAVVALAEIGQDALASEILLYQARIGPESEYAALSRLARELGFVQTQLYMASNAPAGMRADPASHFPAPRWEPLGGWRIDPALAFAHILQESNFRASARSPANAQGLMQIMPITVREHAARLNLDVSQVDIFEPRTNLAFGQRNLEMLQEDPTTRDKLPKIMAAYNAGLTPVRRWESEIRDFGDPLLYMEAIPYWETRSYVAIVMRNYWIYERQANAVSPSRMALAQNQWPAFPAAGGKAGSSGRVFLSSQPAAQEN